MYWEWLNWRPCQFREGNSGVYVNDLVKVIGTLFVSILTVIATAMVIITIISPKGADGASQIFGYEIRVVETNSMEECDATDVSGYEIGSLKKDTMIAITLVPERAYEAENWYAGLKVGDVLTVRYTYNTQLTITHRITAITEKEDGSGYIIELQGDNVASDASQLTQVIDTSDTESGNYVIGKVIWQSYAIGRGVSALQRASKAAFSN